MSPTHRHQSSNMCGKHKLSTFKLLEMFFSKCTLRYSCVCVCVCVCYVCQWAANNPGSDVAIPRVSLSVSAAERASFHWSLVEGRRCSSTARQRVGARSLLSGCHGQRQQILLLSNRRWSANVAQIVRTSGLLFVLLNGVVGPFLTDSLQCCRGFQPHNSAVQWDVCLCLQLCGYTLWVKKKTRHYNIVYNFTKCWPIFKLLSLTDSLVNLQQNFD